MFPLLVHSREASHFFLQVFYFARVRLLQAFGDIHAEKEHVVLRAVAGVGHLLDALFDVDVYEG